MRYGSLFTGIGGIDLGLDMAGMECAWQVEVDEFCREILEREWPNARRYGNIFELDAEELESVDLICGGFPCQPVSVAGQRAGTSDERWLWPEFARIIRQVRPRWVVAENVAGLLSANSGRAFAEVLRDLAESGYDAVWDVFPAGGPGGVGALHRRERIFIVAHSNGVKQATQSRDVGEVSGLSEEGGTDISSVVSGRGSKNVADSIRIGEDFKDVAYTDGSGQQQGDETMEKKTSKQSNSSGVQSRQDVSNTNDSGLQGRVSNRKPNSEGRQKSGDGCSTKRSFGWEGSGDYIWTVEPDVGRVADGVPKRIHRLKALGNAVVPQVAKQIGEMILDTNN